MDQVLALYENIQRDPLEFPLEVDMSSGLRMLLTAMMEKTPDKRITLEKVGRVDVFRYCSKPPTPRQEVVSAS